MKYKTLVIERSFHGRKYNKPLTLRVPEGRNRAEKKLLQYILESLSSRSRLVPFTLNNFSTMKVARHLLFNRTGSPSTLLGYITNYDSFCRWIGAEPDKLANVCKQNVTRFHFEIARLALDLAGGFLATLPSQYDMESENIGGIVKKYFSGVEHIPTEHRIKIARLIEAMTGGTALVELMHGAGSPQAQRIMILREGDLGKKIKLAKALLGIPANDNSTQV